MFATMMTAIATTATSQFVEAFAIAELERIRPIEMTIGARDHGREELHNAKRTEAAEERGEHEVQKTRARDAQTSIGQKLGLAVRCDSGIAAMKANDEPRNAGTFPFERKWNQKRAQAREQKRGRNGEAREHRN